MRLTRHRGELTEESLRAHIEKICGFRNKISRRLPASGTKCEDHYVPKAAEILKYSLSLLQTHTSLFFLFYSNPITFNCAFDSYPSPQGLTFVIGSIWRRESGHRSKCAWNSDTATSGITTKKLPRENSKPTFLEHCSVLLIPQLWFVKSSHFKTRNVIYNRILARLCFLINEVR